MINKIEVFKVLAVKLRVDIIIKLLNGAMCVEDITREFKTTQPNVSYHLFRLKTVGIVEKKRIAHKVFYSINTKKRNFLKTVINMSEEDGGKN